MSEAVRVSGGVLEAMALHAAEAWPDECCGLLIGRGDRILEAVRARNVADDPSRRYLVDPADHFGAIRDARARALAVVGAYHSHPHGPAVPSATDRQEAFEDGHFIHAIVVPARPPRAAQPTIAAYRLTRGNFVAVGLVTQP